MSQKKTIDLSSLNFRIQKPRQNKPYLTSKQQNISPLQNKNIVQYDYVIKNDKISSKNQLQNNQQLEIQTTRNPFEKMKHLFKIVPNYQLSMPMFSQSSQQQNKFKQIITQCDHRVQQMTLFQSFGNNQIFYQQLNLKKSKSNNQINTFNDYQIRPKNQIKYQSREAHQIKIQDYSIIDDDFLKPPTQCRQIDTNRFSIIRSSDGLFLTHNQSKQSIKQFCFNLQELEEEAFKKNNQQCQNKKQAKKIIYSFLDELDFIPPKKITQRVISQLKQTFHKILGKKMNDPNLGQNKQNQKRVIQNRLTNKNSQNQLSSKSLICKRQKSILRNQIKKQIWKYSG